MKRAAALALLLIALALWGDDTMTRSELEARARVAEQARQELREEIEQNQRAIQQNQIAIAELKAHQAVWGTILTLVTGSGVVVTLIKKRKP